MSTIGGPGGIGGPKGPGGPGEPDDLGEPGEPGSIDGPGAPSGIDGPGELDPTGAASSLERQAGVGQAAAASAAGDVDALAAEIAAGRLTPHEAIERLVDATAGPELGPAERAELRELMADLVASDPYLAALAGRVG